jgi:hypothetical protein
MGDRSRTDQEWQIAMSFTVPDVGGVVIRLYPSSSLVGDAGWQGR